MYSIFWQPICLPPLYPDGEKFTRLSFTYCNLVKILLSALYSPSGILFTYWPAAYFETYPSTGKVLRDLFLAQIRRMTFMMKEKKTPAQN